MTNYCQSIFTITGTHKQLADFAIEVHKKSQFLALLIPEPKHFANEQEQEDWRIANWGTKSDFNEDTTYEVNIEEDTITLTVDGLTPWDCPFAAINALLDRGMMPTVHYLIHEDAIAGRINLRGDHETVDTWDYKTDKSELMKDLLSKFNWRNEYEFMTERMAGEGFGTQCDYDYIESNFGVTNEEHENLYDLRR